MGAIPGIEEDWSFITVVLSNKSGLKMSGLRDEGAHASAVREDTMGRGFVAAILGAAVLAWPGAPASAADAKQELAPTGPVRIGLVEAPDAGVFFVARGPDGAPRGVVADLGADLARNLGVAVAFKVFPNSGEATDAVRSGAVDVSFMPVDEARRAIVAFGPGYYDLESTYLVTAAAGVGDVSEVDRPGFRVVAIAGTTTFRASARTLTKTQPVAVPSVAEASAMMRDGRADAFALSRDTLPPIARTIPGSHIVTGGFQRTSVAVAVAKDHAAALAWVTGWLDEAKRDGTVKRIFTANELGDQPVAQ